MLPLVVIVHSPDGQTRRYAFGDSPITIGRSPVAELQLSEAFISRWEGTLRFDSDKITYFSLGGTNPTYANGQLIAENQDVTIGPQTVLTIGSLQLTFLREHVDPKNVRHKGKTAPKVREQEVENKTVFLDMSSVPLRSPTNAPPPLPASKPLMSRPRAPTGEGVRAEPVQVIGEGVIQAGRHPQGDHGRHHRPAADVFVGSYEQAGTARHTPVPSRQPVGAAWRTPRHDSQVNATPSALAAQLDRAHEEYRAGWGELYAQIVAHVDSLAPDRRPQAVSELERRYPLLAQEAEFQTLLRGYGIASTPTRAPAEQGAQEVQAWLRGITRDVVPDTAQFDTHTSLQRIFELIEILTQSFAELNDAQESVRRRWLGRAPRSSVLRSDNANAILAYLLNPQADWPARLRELEQTVRDSVMHELALLKATMEGARNLLAAISPHAIAEAEGVDGESFAEEAGRASLLDRWRGGGGANTEARLWRRFVVMYQSLLDSDRYQRVFMGRVFARTYLAAMGQEQHDTPHRH